MKPSLFGPVQLGDFDLANRIVMAPMTRSRAGEADEPTDLAVEYYRQRATAGLIVTEGTQPSANGKGYLRTPGIHTPEQIRAWRAVTDTVHAEGGRIVAQLMHVGRVASMRNKGEGSETVAPSAIPAKGKIFTDAGMVAMDHPRALEASEIPGVIAEYASATRNALEAGFDGVELHCTSGYLPAQFLASGTNHRTDGYGGSPGNRIRFVMEALEAMSATAGSGRVGFRICPGNPFNDLHDDDPEETHRLLLEAASSLKLAYLHLIDLANPQCDGLALAGKSWNGSLILNEGMTLARAEQALAEGVAQAFSFGRSFIANPDFVARLRHGLPLADFDVRTLYTPGAEGYVDYPAFEA